MFFFFFMCANMHYMPCNGQSYAFFYSVYAFLNKNFMFINIF